jgi:hypothetical protein
VKCVLEHNKEFESFTEEFKEKIDSMQKALQKTQGFDDYLISIRGITNESTVQLQPNFQKLKGLPALAILSNVYDNI